MPSAFLKTVVPPALMLTVLASGTVFADGMPQQPAAGARVGVLDARAVSSVAVTLDFAKILSFGQPARTVIIGNPGIVDGTLSDEETIVLTGKSVGTTNVIVLGDGGREIANLVVNVIPNRSQLTTVYHGDTRQIFSCTGPCNPLAPPIVSNPAPAEKQ